MITDLFLAPLALLLEWLTDLLPEGQPLDLPTVAPIVDMIAKVDSIVPISTAVLVAISLFPIGLAFIVFRLVVVVRHILLP